ncbi:MAG: cyclase family protein [Alphaproteobacteria bacterium]|nr:cyclase family protein [Alphaproteobacteria bacterium]
MKKLLALLLLSACASNEAPVVGSAQLIRPFSAGAIIDLTHELHEDMPYWPGGVPFRMERLVDYDQGYRLHKFEVGENTGTHVDAPAHFVEGNWAIDQIPLQRLIVPAVVIDIQDKVAADPDYQLMPPDIVAWESKYGRIPKNALVILNTGWHKRFGDAPTYVNMDDGGVMHFPGYHPRSAALLIDRKIVGAGIDTLSLDNGPSKTFDFHRVMLEANKYQIENLANLDALPPTGATVFVGVLPVMGGSQAQARVVALLP